ncbi:PAS domain-containing sensor histidine kinase [Halobacterium rubrum]|uniref:PAS domain-containing sensor histidine kinase n=1 Tax=Halobacterium TaxID=2239 RepID=UPI001F1C8624|nr:MULTISPECIES: PAS domain-containing sensor histidine kinase [Halobacterium]MDH5020931.1 PAS domain-containing sensor histidine kinase [Halobacterium rubrum]
MSDTPLRRNLSESDRGLRREIAELLFGPQSWYAGVVGPDGRLEYANDAARELVGASEGDVDGEFFWETPWFEHDPEVQAAVRDRVAAAVGGEACEFRSTHVDAEGETVTVDLELQPMPALAVDDGEETDREETDEESHAVAVTGQPVDDSATADVAAALETLRALLERTASGEETGFAERVQAVLELGSDYLGLPVGFYTRIDGDAQFVRASVGDHPLLQPGEQADLLDTYCKDTIAADSPNVLEDVGESPFGDDRAYDVFGLECYVGSEIRLDGTTHGTVCFADRDAHPEPITAADEAFVDLLASWLERELEHERERDRLGRQADRLDEFAGVVSHDLRSPLNAASGHLELAAERLDEGEDGAASVAEAQSAVDRMSELVEEVRELASQGTVVGDLEVVSLAEVATAAASTALPETASLTVDTDAGERLAADPERLRTVFENLFRNAVEHGGEDVAVTVASVDPQSGGGEAGFSVADDGPGFGDTDPGDVFEQGFTTRTGGTGYGLSIVEAVVEAHGWTVSAGNGEDGGARFDVRGVEFEPEL